MKITIRNRKISKNRKIFKGSIEEKLKMERKMVNKYSWKSGTRTDPGHIKEWIEENSQILVDRIKEMANDRNYMNDILSEEESRRKEEGYISQGYKSGERDLDEYVIASMKSRAIAYNYPSMVFSNNENSALETTNGYRSGEREDADEFLVAKIKAMADDQNYICISEEERRIIESKHIEGGWKSGTRAA